MKTAQPVWKLLANIGDVHPIEYGGYFVFVDETGVYPPEAELLISPDSDDAPEGWVAYRFILDPCTYVDGILSDNHFHPELPAWFADAGVGEVANFAGLTEAELVAMFTADNALARARAWELVGRYHGFDNLDSYPMHFATRAEVEARYVSASVSGPALEFRKRETRPE